MSGAKALIFEIIGVDKASATFEKVSAAVTASTTKMEKMQKASAIAGKALLIGAAGAAVGLYEASKAATEDQASQAKLAQQLKNTTGATGDQIDKVNEWIDAQAKAKGNGVEPLRDSMAALATATGSVSKAQKLLLIAQDASAGTGKSLSTITGALVKAQNGSVGSLSRLGIATKDAQGNTLSFNQVLASMAGKYQGAAAKAAETTAGKQRILGVEIHELAVKIGTEVLPAMAALVGVLISVVDWTSRHTHIVGIALGVIAGLAATIWAVGFAMKAWAAITKIATAAQWLLNVAMDANPIGLLVIAIAALVVGLIIAYKHSETFRKIVNAVFADIKKFVVGAVTFVVAFVKTHWMLLVGLLGGPLALAVVAVIKHWNAIKTGVSTILGAIKSTVKNLWGDVTGIVTKGASDILDAIRGIPGDIKALGSHFADAGKAIITQFVNGMKNAGGVVEGIAGNVWSAVKGLLNSAIAKINSALSFTIPLPGPDIHVSTSIPYLAKGGIVTRPTLAMIGEAGPEAVIPLSRAGGVGGSGGESNLTVNLVLDGRVVQQSLLKLKRTNGNLELGLA